MHQLVALQEKGNELIAEVEKLLSQSRSQNLQKLAREIPHAVLEDGGGVLVVFCGQQSAGKSSIISALTGRSDVKIGGGIVTDEVKGYAFGGITVVDTPGILTGVREEHDAKSYEAISKADLVVYVTTSQLFDTTLQRDFSRLAYERNKAPEMMLVVNKMSDNSDAARKVKLGTSGEAGTLSVMVAPKSPEDFYTTFICCEDWFKAQKTTNEILRSEMIKNSGIKELEETLERFVKDKKIAGKYTKALTRLEYVLEKALAEDSTGDENMDGLEILLLQKKNTLLDVEKNVRSRTAGIIQRGGAEIRDKGRTILGMFDTDQDVEGECKGADAFVKKITEDAAKQIEGVLMSEMKSADERVSQLFETEFATRLSVSLSSAAKKANVSPETESKLKNLSQGSKTVGEFLVKHSIGHDGLSGLRSFAGSDAHSIVLKVGHIFGKNFKPWEAVKWAKWVNVGGKVISVAGIALTLFLQYREDRAEEKKSAERRQMRMQLRDAFNGTADAIEMKFDETINSFVAENLKPRIDEVSGQLDEIRQLQDQHGAQYDQLVGCLARTRELIAEVNALM